MLMHLGMTSVAHHPWVPVTLTFASDLISRNCFESDISPILFEVGIPNLVWKCILGWWSVTYHIRVTVTLTFDLVLRILVWSTSLTLFKFVNASWMAIWCVNAS